MDDWDADLEAAPVFRHFTREEKEKVEKRIFAKKIALKKRAEKQAKNIAVSFCLALNMQNIFNAVFDIKRLLNREIVLSYT